MLKGVEINPGKLCNNRCVFCMSGYERDEHTGWADLEEVEAELASFYEKGMRAVGFVGGEPTVYPRLVEAVAAASKMGYVRISVCTNGVRLADPRYALRLVDAGVTRVTLSAHSVRPEVEEALTGVPGVLAKKVRALRNLARLRAAGLLRDNISLNPVLCRLNMGEMVEIASVFKALGVDDIRFNFIWPQARVRRDKAVVPSYREAVPFILAYIGENEARLRIRSSFGAVPFCVLPGILHRRPALLKRYFDESGLDLERENAVSRRPGGGFEKFDWFEMDRGDYKIRRGECEACLYRPRCQGVYESYVELYGWNEFQPARACA